VCDLVFVALPLSRDPPKVHPELKQRLMESTACNFLIAPYNIGGNPSYSRQSKINSSTVQVCPSTLQVAIQVTPDNPNLIQSTPWGSPSLPQYTPGGNPSHSSTLQVAVQVTPDSSKSTHGVSSSSTAKSMFAIITSRWQSKLHQTVQIISYSLVHGAVCHQHPILTINAFKKSAAE